MAVRKVCGKMVARISSRHFGEREKDCVRLRGEEYLYLVEKGVIKDSFAKVFREEADEKNFDIRYLVYRDLRNRGYTISFKDDAFHARKSFSMDFYLVSDLQAFDPEIALKVEKPYVLGVVDFDGDITYYLVDLEEPSGEAKTLPQKHNLEILGNRAVVFENPEILKGSTFGTYEGKFAHLSLLEAKYLAEKGIVDDRIDMDTPLYRVYRDLRERGLIVKSGFKYGTHFRAYEKSMEEHSRYLVHVISGREDVQKVGRAVRVAHGVRKDLLLAYPRDNIFYFVVKWIRP